MADEVTDLKSQIAIERENAKQLIEAQKAEIELLKKRAKAAETQVDIATSGQGIPLQMAADVARRMNLGLSKDMAIDCARRQWENDLANQAAEQAKLPKAEAPKPAPVVTKTNEPVSTKPEQAASAAPVGKNK